MIKKSQVAKSNLKKSLYFSGGIGLFTIGGGLAVSIPVYFSIKDQLNKSKEKLEDISSYISDLTTKLGISPDEEFVKELEGGYELVYSKGKVKVYKKKKGGKGAIVISLNPDGTVGSAGEVEGAAAKAVTDLIESAAKTLEGEGDAIESILKPIVEEVENKSIAIESAVTGKSEEEIRARNAFATKSEKEKKKRYQELQDKIQKEKEAAEQEAIHSGHSAQIENSFKETLKTYKFFKANQYDINNVPITATGFTDAKLKLLTSQKIFNAANEKSLKTIFTSLPQDASGAKIAKEIAEAAFTARIIMLRTAGEKAAADALEKQTKEAQERLKDKAAALKKQREELKKQIQAAQSRLKETYKKGILSFYLAYTKETNGSRASKIKIDEIGISDYEKEEINKFIHLTNKKQVESLINDPKLSVKDVENIYDATRSARMIIDALIKAQIEKDKAEENAAKNNKDILIKIASSLDSFANTVARSYGYKNLNDPHETEIIASKVLREKLISKAKETGFSIFAIQKIDDYIKKALNIQNANTISSKRIKFSIELNTFNEANPDISQLVVLKSTITEYKPNQEINKKDEYIISKSGGHSYLSLRKMVFSDSFSNKPNYFRTIKNLISVGTNKYIPTFRHKALKALSNETQNPGSIAVVKSQDPLTFNKIKLLLDKFIQYNKSENLQSKVKANYYKNIALNLLDQYLFKSLPINFDSNDLVVALENSYQMDGGKFAPKNTQGEFDDKFDLTKLNGTYMNLLTNFIAQQPFDKTMGLQQFDEVTNLLGPTANAFKQFKLDQSTVKKLLLGSNNNYFIKDLFTNGNKTELNNVKNIFTRFLKINNSISKKLVDGVFNFNNSKDLYIIFKKYYDAKQFNLLHNWIDKNNEFIIDLFINKKGKDLFSNAINLMNNFNNYSSTYTQSSIENLFKNKQLVEKLVFSYNLDSNNQIKNSYVNDIVKLTPFQDLFKDVQGFNFDWGKLLDLIFVLNVNTLNNHLQTLRTFKQNNNSTILFNSQWNVTKELLLKNKSSIYYQLYFWSRIIQKKSPISLSNNIVFELTKKLEDLSSYFSKKRVNINDSNKIIENLEDGIIDQDLQPIKFNNILEFIHSLYDSILAPSSATLKIQSLLNNINDSLYKDITIFNKIFTKVKLSQEWKTTLPSEVTSLIKNFFRGEDTFKRISWVTNISNNFKHHFMKTEDNQWILTRTQNYPNHYILNKVDKFAGSLILDQNQLIDSASNPGLNDFNKININDLIFQKGTSKDYIFIGDKNDGSYIFAINVVTNEISKINTNSKVARNNIFVLDKNLYFINDSKIKKDVQSLKLASYKTALANSKIVWNTSNLMNKSIVAGLKYQTEATSFTSFSSIKNDDSSDIFALSWISKNSAGLTNKLVLMPNNSKWKIKGNTGNNSKRVINLNWSKSNPNITKPLEIIFGNDQIIDSNSFIKNFYTLNELGGLSNFRLLINTAMKTIEFMDGKNDKIILIDGTGKSPFLIPNQIRPIYFDDKLWFYSKNGVFYYDWTVVNDKLKIFKKLIE